MFKSPDLLRVDMKRTARPWSRKGVEYIFWLVLGIIILTIILLISSNALKLILEQIGLWT